MALLYQSATRNLPDGYTFRGATSHDIPVIVYLFNLRPLNAANFQVEALRSEWQTQRFNPAMDVRLVFDQREHLIGYIEVWTDLNSLAHPWVWGCVHPEYEGRGIGTALLRWAEARVRLAMDMLPMLAAPRFGTLHSLTTAQALCEALGWQPVRKADEPAQPKKTTGALRLAENAGLLAAGLDVYEKQMN